MINHLVSTLDKQNTHRVYLLWPRKFRDCSIVSSLRNIETIEYAVPNRLKFFASHYVLEEVARKIGADVVHSDISGHCVKSCSNVVTLHDFSFMIHRDQNKNVVGDFYWNTIYTRSLKRATVIKVISPSTLRDAERYLPGLDYKLIWQRIDSVAPFVPHTRSWSSPRRILIVGSIIPRRNIGFAISALARTNIDYLLDIVGQPGWGFKDIKELIDGNNRIRYHGFVDEQTLDSFYNEADLYLSASLYEGFGYPVVEALSRRCPVLLSDTSSYMDLVGAQYRFDLNYDDFIFKITRMFSANRDAVLSDQVVLLERLTEDKYLSAHLELYEYAIGKYRGV
jgi:glycosyltransferase involved in cell wall biosynthesis